VGSKLLRSPELFNEVISAVVASISFFYEQQAELLLRKELILAALICINQSFDL
jgi:hypothetical protein